MSASIFVTLSPARLAAQRHRDNVFLCKAAYGLIMFTLAWHRRLGLAIACECRYDSAGVCIDGAARTFVIVKATGKVDCLEDLANEQINHGGAGFPGDEVAARFAIPALRNEPCSRERYSTQQQLCLPQSMDAADQLFRV